MSDKTRIEWATASWNPLRGQNARHTCARISPGCDNCYAATMSRRGLGGTAAIDYGKGEAPNDPSRLDEKALIQPSRWKKPRTIFVCSMTDLFGSWVPDEWLNRIFDEMENNPQHTYQVLTKRPTRMHDYINCRWTGAYQPQFIWLGVSIESNVYTWRAHALRDTNAAVRWISAEPLLSGLPSLDLTGIDWLVAGGESGAKARPMHPDWPRALRDRCQAAGVAYFFKQWGEWSPDRPHSGIAPGSFAGRLRSFKPDGTEYSQRGHDWNDPGMVSMYRIGKKTAGRLLDGRTWDEFPLAASTPPPTAAAGSEDGRAELEAAQ
jgi:protein gp37